MPDFGSANAGNRQSKTAEMFSRLYFSENKLGFLEKQIGNLEKVVDAERISAKEAERVLLDRVYNLENVAQNAEARGLALAIAALSKLEERKTAERSRLNVMLANFTRPPDEKNSFSYKIDLITQSELLDKAKYLTDNRDLIGEDCNYVENYVDKGWKNLRDPNSCFDVFWYIINNFDVFASGTEPLTHYIEFGTAEGRDPHPLFSTRWYISKYASFLEPGQNPLAHFIKTGAAKGFWPHPLFDISFYQRTCSEDYSDAPWKLLDHYIKVGAAKGLKPNEYFDPVWYYRINPDVVASGIEPLQHFLQWGGYEGRSPSENFDVVGYLKENPNLQKDNINFLVHFFHGG